MSTREEELQARLDALEMTVAEQQREIDDLNAMVTKQWDTLGLYKAQINKMIDQISDLEQGDGPAANQKPPHY
ncbi:SlyX family protein [Kiloniella sp. b19]|uniref:SlyX family protein n=1 Tax=Kiloniella sp. GXU_MW_B19 TaxID=3141326 RepID=UPI0031CF672C